MKTRKIPRDVGAPIVRKNQLRHNVLERVFQNILHQIPEFYEIAFLVPLFEPHISVWVLNTLGYRSLMKRKFIFDRLIFLRISRFGNAILLCTLLVIGITFAEKIKIQFFLGKSIVI